jgi:hypothetical protein
LSALADIAPDTEHRVYSEPWIGPGKNNDINELEGIFLNAFFTSRAQTDDPETFGQEGRIPEFRSAALTPKGIGARIRMRRSQGMARIFVIRANLLGLSARGRPYPYRLRRYPDHTPRTGHADQRQRIFAAMGRLARRRKNYRLTAGRGGLFREH